MEAEDCQVICDYLSNLLGISSAELDASLRNTPRNVRLILRRQITSISRTSPSRDKLVCQIDGQDELLRVLWTSDRRTALFTLARIYDEAHIMFCKTAAAAKQNKKHNSPFLKDPHIDVRSLAEDIKEDKSKIDDIITLTSVRGRSNILEATWTHNYDINFNRLPVLENLSGVLPGEVFAARQYAGIGGGGGSDVISASLLGHLLRGAGKEMNLLVSTRTWKTGSQGNKGSKMGLKREIHQHGGAALIDGKVVGGTYRIEQETWSEGRDLETVPVKEHDNIFIVLDQGEETEGIIEEDKADLTDQFRAVLSQGQTMDSIIVVDTGGDVFGGTSPNFSTPDQDIRVQRAMSKLKDTYPNLVTAVLAPGVDAPADAPEKAEKAGAKVYRPTDEENAMLLDLLTREYQMDGSNPDRYGKTSLCLQERLKGTIGWTSLNMPEHVVDTWENPWSTFVFIRECMSDIILMPLVDLLPLIDPEGP